MTLINRIHVRRGALAAVVLLAVLAATATIAGAATGHGPASTSVSHHPSQPLTILLTNDDGVTGPGLIAVRDALCDAGQRVTVVGPATDQSGSGGKISVTGSLTATQSSFSCGGRSSTTWAVAGTPADTVYFGTSVVFGNRRPDLVVSGSNAGNNMSTAVVHSGTVGAAVTATNLGIPALAVSSGVAPSTVPDPTAQTEAGYRATAAYVARLVGQLQADRHRGSDRLLPEGLYLNVNYPLPLDRQGRFDPAQVGRAVWTRLARQQGPTITYQPAGGDQYTMAFSPCAVAPGTPGCPNEPESDVSAIAHDHVSVTALTGLADLTPPGRVRAELIGAVG